MPKITFIPSQSSIDVSPGSKILLAAIKANVDIRFGCASCQCGTCAVKIKLLDQGDLSPMKENEKNLLTRMQLPTDGEVRLSCQARVNSGDLTVDLDFQSEYSPDQSD